MNTLDQHIKDTLNLSNSLVLKLNSSAFSINKGVVLKYNTPIENDKKTWKYYLNISGQKHFTNKPVYINTVEDKTRIELTVDTLNKYDYTKKELSKFGDLYNKILLEYPEEESYIKGVIAPIDIDKAIQAEEGDILYYNRSLVEESELSLIPELQKHIKDFINRWYNSKYSIAEELYTPAFQAILYTSIFNKIFNIRLDKIHTHEAHSFHLEQYFNSNFNLWDDLSIFKLSTKYWLYKHLPFLIKELGQNNTLDTIINKVLEENNIGVAEFLLSYKDPVKHHRENEELSYDQPEINIRINNRNDSYDVTESVYREIDKVLKDELNTIKYSIDRDIEDDYIINNSIKQLNNIDHNRRNELLTKVIDIKLNNIFKLYSIDIFTLVFDYWAYKAKNRHDTYIVEWLDPNDLSQSFSLNYYQAFLLATKLLLNIIDSEHKQIKSYNYNVVLNSDKNSLIYMYNKMYRDGITDINVTNLVHNYPRVDAYLFSPERAYDFITEIFKYQSYIWCLDANSEGIIQQAAIKQLFYYTYQKGSLNFDNYVKPKDRNIGGYTIDHLLKMEGIKYEIKDTFNIMESLNDLVKTVWGINIDWYYTRDEILSKCKSFLGKMTAYTTQVISSSGDVKSNYVYYNTLNVFKAKNAIVGDIKGRFCSLEHEFVRSKAIGHNIIDDPIKVIENYDKKRSNYEIIPMESGIGDSNFSYPVIIDNEWWTDPTITNVKLEFLSKGRDTVDVITNVPVTYSIIETVTTNKNDIINNNEDIVIDVDLQYTLEDYLEKRPLVVELPIRDYDAISKQYSLFNNNSGINITKENDKLRLEITETGYRTFILNSIQQQPDPLQDIRYPDKSTRVVIRIDNYDKNSKYTIVPNDTFIEVTQNNDTITYIRQPDTKANIKINKEVVEKASGNYITKYKINNYKRYLDYTIRALDSDITNIKQEEDLITYTCSREDDLGIQVTAVVNKDRLPIRYDTVVFDKRTAPRTVVELRDEFTYDKTKSENLISNAERLKEFLEQDIDKPKTI